jgi:hypothetical protein
LAGYRRNGRQQDLKKPPAGRFINGGFMVLDKRAFEYIPEDNCPFEQSRCIALRLTAKSAFTSTTDFGRHRYQQGYWKEMRFGIRGKRRGNWGVDLKTLFGGAYCGKGYW